MSRGQVFILSAPSGTGKTTILKQVMARIDRLAFSVSHTTRAPRAGEEDGVAYHFVSHQCFQEMINQGDFLEYAEVHGNFYGTSRAAVVDQLLDGFDVVLDIDVQGMRILRESKKLEGITIFLAPPAIEELERRLKGRGVDTNETIALRIANARWEMEAVDEYEYLIVNDVLEDAVRMLEGIVIAERARARRSIHGVSQEMKRV